MPTTKPADVLADLLASSDADRTTVLSALSRLGGSDVLSQHVRAAHRRTTEPGPAERVARWESFI